MATTVMNYASEAGITITLNSLADGGIRASTSIDNTTSKYIDALVMGVIRGATSADGYAYVYAYGSTDGGTKFSGSVTGTDAAYGGSAGQVKENLKFLGAVKVDAGAEDFECGPWSVAQAFGGILPEDWGIVVEWIDSGTVALDSSNNVMRYQGVKYDTA